MAHILSQEANVTDIEVLQGALLHDTVEDTETTLEEIEKHFGSNVRCVPRYMPKICSHIFVMVTMLLLRAIRICFAKAINICLPIHVLFTKTLNACTSTVIESVGYILLKTTSSETQVF